MAFSIYIQELPNQAMPHVHITCIDLIFCITFFHFSLPPSLIQHHAGDFGVISMNPTADSSVEEAGVMLFWAPEVCEGKIINRKADIWALGIVVLEMLNGGKAPYEDDHMEEEDVSFFFFFFYTYALFGSIFIDPIFYNDEYNNRSSERLLCKADHTIHGIWTTYWLISLTAAWNEILGYVHPPTNY